MRYPQKYTNRLRGYDAHGKPVLERVPIPQTEKPQNPPNIRGRSGVADVVLRARAETSPELFPVHGHATREVFTEQATPGAPVLPRLYDEPYRLARLLREDARVALAMADAIEREFLPVDSPGGRDAAMFGGALPEREYPCGIVAVNRLNASRVASKSGTGISDDFWIGVMRIPKEIAEGGALMLYYIYDICSPCGLRFYNRRILVEGPRDEWMSRLYQDRDSFQLGPARPGIPGHPQDPGLRPPLSP